MNGIYTQDGVIQKDELWTKYRHIVRNEALRLQVKLPASVELDDLIQAGTIGLLGAIDQFDPKKGVGLGAYVTQRIRWAMIDELREYDWVPRRVRSNSGKYLPQSGRLSRRVGLLQARQALQKC